MERHSVDSALDTEKLLRDVDSSSEDRFHKSRQIIRYRYGMLGLLALFALTNLGWWTQYWQARLMESSLKRTSSPSDLVYFLEGDDQEQVLVPFEHDWQDLELVDAVDQHGYRYADVQHGGTRNVTIGGLIGYCAFGLTAFSWADDKWVPNHGGAVALSRQFVEENNLSSGAAPLQEKPSEFHYLVAGYHQLHCLSEVRDAIYYLNGTLKEWPRQEPFQWNHIIHCIEAIRQAVQCGLDPTLIPLDSYWPGIINGQRHVCRNSDALFRWTSRFSHALPEYTKQAPPARTKEWYDRTENLDLPPWRPVPGGPPLDQSLVV